MPGLDLYDSLPIRTPEGIAFRLPLAGPFNRFLAWLVDAAGSSALTVFVITLVQPIAIVGEDYAAAAATFAAFAIHIGYNMVQEWFWRGQTIGKALMKIRVVDAEGLRLQPSQIFLRNILRAVDALPALYALGGASMLLNPRRQRLGDLAANTIVVRRVTAAIPDLAALMPDKYNSFRACPPAEARLRQRVPAEGAALIADALMRRGELEPKARVAVYGEIAAWLRELAPFPDEVCLGLSDEQYLRNTLESLHRRPGATKKEPGAAPQVPAAAEPREQES